MFRTERNRVVGWTVTAPSVVVGVATNSRLGRRQEPRSTEAVVQMPHGDPAPSLALASEDGYQCSLSARRGQRQMRWVRTRRFGPKRALVSVAALALIGTGCLGSHVPSPPLRPPSVPAAPALTATAVSGECLSLAAARGRWPMLFFFCGCDRCVQAASELNRFLQGSRRRVVWGFTEMNAADICLFARKAGVHFPLATDRESNWRQQFAVDHCPAIVLVNPDGRIQGRWKGTEGRSHATLADFLRAQEAENDH
jgi:peroxiredoxin